MPKRKSTKKPAGSRSTSTGQELLDKLTEEVSKLTSGLDWQHMLDLARTGYSYSFGNLLLARIQGCEGQFASYTYWKAHSRIVRKGEKAIYILRPLLVNKKKDEDDPDAPKRPFLVGFGGAPVFGIEQTDGPPLPEPPPLLDGEAPEGLLDRVAKLIEDEGFKFIREDIAGGAEGYTSFGSKKVVVKASHGDLAGVNIALHELGHVLTMTEEDRKNYGDRYHRGVAEVEAQSVSYVVRAKLGVPTDDMDFYYVGVWSGGNLDLVRKTGTKVLKVAGQVIAALGGTAKEEAA